MVNNGLFVRVNDFNDVIALIVVRSSARKRNHWKRLDFIWNLLDVNVRKLLANDNVWIVELKLRFVNVDNCFESQWTFVGWLELSQEHSSHTCCTSPVTKPNRKMDID